MSHIQDSQDVILNFEGETKVVKLCDLFVALEVPRVYLLASFRPNLVQNLAQSFLETYEGGAVLERVLEVVVNCLLHIR